MPCRRQAPLTPAAAGSRQPPPATHSLAPLPPPLPAGGNRSQKVNSSSYQAFDSPSYPKLATLGIDVDWNEPFLLRPEGTYKPRFKVRAAWQSRLLLAQAAPTAAAAGPDLPRDPLHR
jgi:hypothetical protein